MADTAFQNVDDEMLAAVAARKVVLENYRLAVNAGTEPGEYDKWIELTQAEYDALGSARREGVLYAIVG